jgi:RAI1 like PD-(D/E)XK nuclease
VKFERKLLKFWAQSFLLGVPKIIVGFRTGNGILTRLDELETQAIPEMVKRGTQLWDGNVCINFAAGFLECEICSILFVFWYNFSEAGLADPITMSRAQDGDRRRGSVEDPQNREITLLGGFQG